MLENCRLCQIERGTVEIACNGELIDKIYKCSGIKVGVLLVNNTVAMFTFFFRLMTNNRRNYQNLCVANAIKRLILFVIIWRK